MLKRSACLLACLRVLFYASLETDEPAEPVEETVQLPVYAFTIVENTSSDCGLLTARCGNPSATAMALAASRPRASSRGASCRWGKSLSHHVDQSLLAERLRQAPDGLPQSQAVRLHVRMATAPKTRPIVSVTARSAAETTNE